MNDTGGIPPETSPFGTLIAVSFMGATADPPRKANAPATALRCANQWEADRNAANPMPELGGLKVTLRRRQAGRCPKSPDRPGEV